MVVVFPVCMAFPIGMAFAVGMAFVCCCGRSCATGCIQSSSWSQLCARLSGRRYS